MENNSLELIPGAIKESESLPTFNGVQTIWTHDQIPHCRCHVVSSFRLYLHGVRCESDLHASQTCLVLEPGCCWMCLFVSPLPPPQPCNTPHLQYFQHIDDFIKGFLKSTSIFQFVCCIVPRTSLNWILHYNNQFRLLRIFCLQQEQWYHEIWSLYDSLCTFWSVENSMINIVTLMKCKCSNLLSHFKYFGLHFIIGSCLQYIGSSRQYISIGN